MEILQLLLLKKPHLLKHNWKDIFKSLKIIFEHPNDTKQFFIIMRTLNNSVHEKSYFKYGNNERIEIIEMLSNDKLLDTMPDGSVGAEYRKFTQQNNFSAKNIADISKAIVPEIEGPEPVNWAWRRYRDIHDIWHVLTGYDQSNFGEVCVSAFTHGQHHATGQLLFVFTAIVNSIQRKLYFNIPAFYEAYQHGKKAKWLFAEDYKSLLYEPLVDARIRLNIKSPIKYNHVKSKMRILAREYIKKNRKRPS